VEVMGLEPTTSTLRTFDWHVPDQHSSIEALVTVSQRASVATAADN
jgi:hypothetical protein